MTNERSLGRFATLTERVDAELACAETDHRAANSFQFAASMLRHESHTVSDVDGARRALEDASVRLAAMARLHRQLSAEPPGGTVMLTEVLGPICEDIRRGVGVATVVKASGIALTARVAAQIGVVVSELAMNAAKHAGCDGRMATLCCSAVRPRSGGLRVTLRDDGPGLPDGFDLARPNGLGMIIVTATVEKLDGTIRVLPGAGAGFRIELPSA